MLHTMRSYSPFRLNEVPLAKHPIPVICCVCGEDEGLEAHHLKPRAITQAEGVEDGPTIWLCREHHGLAHGVKWSGNIAELSRLGRERHEAEHAHWTEQEREVSEVGYAVAVEMGAKPDRVPGHLRRFMFHLDKTLEVLQQGRFRYLIELHRESGMTSYIDYARYRDHLAAYVYQPITHGLWRV